MPDRAGQQKAQPKPASKSDPTDGPPPKLGNQQRPHSESMPKEGEPVPAPIVTKPGGGSGERGPPHRCRGRPPQHAL